MRQEVLAISTFLFIRRLSDLVDYLARWFTVILTVGFTLVIFGSVLSRYVFHHPILFAQGVGKVLFVWACFMAATIAYKRHKHIRFEFLSRVLGNRGLYLTDIIVYISGLVFFIFLFINSLSFTIQIWGTFFPIIGISQGWLYISEIIASAIFSLHSIAHILEWFEDLRSGRPYSELDDQRQGDQ